VNGIASFDVVVDVLQTLNLPSFEGTIKFHTVLRHSRYRRSFHESEFFDCSKGVERHVQSLSCSTLFLNGATKVNVPHSTRPCYI